MTKYLVASDNDRGDLDSMKRILELADHHKADIIFAGDFGPAVCESPQVLTGTNRKIFTVPGNWDSVEGYSNITKLDNVIDLHEKLVDDFVGYGGSYEIPPYPGANPRDWYCRDVDEEKFFLVTKQAKQKGIGKLVLHKPPYGIGDLATFARVEGGFMPVSKDDPRAVTEHRGQEFVRYIIDEKFSPRLIVAGHFHTPYVSDFKGNEIKPNTDLDQLFVNPGPSYAGYAAIINDDPIEKKVRYEGHVTLE